MNKSLNELAKEIHANARDKGFFEKEKNIGEMLCLIHSEVSEALEADRKDHFANVDCFEAFSDWDRPKGDAFSFESTIKNSFEDELADVIIRVLDLCAFKNIDIEKHIALKMKYNSLREKYHSKKY